MSDNDAPKPLRDTVASYTLKKPARIGEVEYETLDFVEPDLEMLEAMERASRTSSMHATIKLISDAASIPMEAARKIKGTEITAIMGVLRPLLPAPDKGSLDSVGVDVLPPI